MRRTFERLNQQSIYINRKYQSGAKTRNALGANVSHVFWILRDNVRALLVGIVLGIVERHLDDMRCGDFSNRKRRTTSHIPNRGVKDMISGPPVTLRRVRIS